jgi:hypothetical protein
MGKLFRFLVSSDKQDPKEFDFECEGKSEEEIIEDGEGKICDDLAERGEFVDDIQYDGESPDLGVEESTMRNWMNDYDQRGRTKISDHLSRFSSYKDSDNSDWQRSRKLKEERTSRFLYTDDDE